MDKFCTLSSVKTYMGLTNTDSDTLIEDMIIPQVTESIKNYCRRLFIRQTYVEYYTTEYNRNPTRYYLNELNIDEDSVDIKIKGQTIIADSDWTTVQSLSNSYYQVDSSKGYIDVLVGVFDSIKGMRVSYTAGYERDVSDTDLILVPYAVNMACVIQSSFMSERVSSRSLGMTSNRSMEGGSDKIIPSALTLLEPIAMSLIAPYRRLLIR